MRRVALLLQFGGGSNGWRGGMPTGMNNLFDSRDNKNPLQPADAAEMQKSFMNKVCTPDFRQAVSNMMNENRPKKFEGGSGMGGKIGIMAFGKGVNEKGKRVARGAKMELDLQNKKMSTDFMEQQLDPDDIMLPKETVENYDTSNAIEVDVNEATTKGGASGSGGSSAQPATEHVSDVTGEMRSAPPAGTRKVREAEILNEFPKPADGSPSS